MPVRIHTERERTPDAARASSLASTGPRSHHAAASTSATTTTRSRAQSVCNTLPNALNVLCWRSGVGVVSERLVPHAVDPPGQRGGHHDQCADRGRPRLRRGSDGARASTTIPATSTAGPASAFTDIAAPAARPDVHRIGEARVVAIPERERDREHRQRERRSVGVQRAGDPEDGAARGHQPGGKERVRREW